MLVAAVATNPQISPAKQNGMHIAKRVTWLDID